MTIPGCEGDSDEQLHVPRRNVVKVSLMIQVMMTLPRDVNP